MRPLTLMVGFFPGEPFNILLVGNTGRVFYKTETYSSHRPMLLLPHVATTLIGDY